MKNYIFRNPFKEALETQGKRWFTKFWTAVAMMAILAAFCLTHEMPVFGNVATVVVAMSSVFFICFFGFEEVIEEAAFEEE